MNELFMFADRRSAPAFWLGTLAVVIGVMLHLPMFVMARSMHYQLAGMPMGGGMLFGMACIVGGVAAAVYGLRPKSAAADGPMTHERIAAPEDAPLTVWHWAAGAALSIALVVDTMKISSPGFVIPGMSVEYGITPAEVALLPFSALSGATLGSFIWGMLADHYGRRATILLSGVMFVATVAGAWSSSVARVPWAAFSLHRDSQRCFSLNSADASCGFSIWLRDCC